MLKNKELRYYFSFILNKKLPMKKRCLNFILIICLLAIISFICILSIAFFKNAILKYKISAGFIVIATSVLSLISAYYIHNDVKTRNLLVKISFGINYRKYIKGVSTTPKLIIFIISCIYFITIGFQINDWQNAFLYFLRIYSLSILLFSCFLYMWIFMANIELIFLVSILLIIGIIFLLYQTHVFEMYLIHFIKGLSKNNMLIIFIDFLMISLGETIGFYLIPKLNFVNWFDDAPEIYT